MKLVALMFPPQERNRREPGHTAAVAPATVALANGAPIPPPTPAAALCLAPAHVLMSASRLVVICQ